jgi:hypothetical protein
MVQRGQLAMGVTLLSILVLSRYAIGAQRFCLNTWTRECGKCDSACTRCCFPCDNAFIFSSVEAGGVGKGGNIDINAATLSLIDGAQLIAATRGASNTQPAGRGDAGNVNVNVTGAVDITGEKNGFLVGFSARWEQGQLAMGETLLSPLVYSR